LVDLERRMTTEKEKKEAEEAQRIEEIRMKKEYELKATQEEHVRIARGVGNKKEEGTTRSKSQQQELEEKGRVVEEEQR
jgi:hypothetical protein